MPHAIPENEASELLERLLEQDGEIEELERQIRSTREAMKDLRESLHDALKGRAKLSRSCRESEPAPLFSGNGAAS